MSLLTIPAAVLEARFGVQEVKKADRQFQIGAFVPVDRVGPPALEQAVPQVPHAAVLLPSQQVGGEEELGVLPVEPLSQLLIQGFQVA